MSHSSAAAAASDWRASASRASCAAASASACAAALWQGSGLRAHRLCLPYTALDPRVLLWVPWMRM